MCWCTFPFTRSEYDLLFMIFFHFFFFFWLILCCRPPSAAVVSRDELIEYDKLNFIGIHENKVTTVCWDKHSRHTRKKKHSISNERTTLVTLACEQRVTISLWIDFGMAQCRHYLLFFSFTTQSFTATFTPLNLDHEHTLLMSEIGLYVDISSTIVICVRALYTSFTYKTHFICQWSKIDRMNMNFIAALNFFFFFCIFATCMECPSFIIF